MCVLFLAYHMHDQFPLVVAANRDEAYDRPALQAHFWEDEPNILAGRDLLMKGTWLGVSRIGKFAALTNVRGPLSHSSAALKSRGWIISDYLKSELTAEQHILTLQQSKQEYPGYNVLLADTQSLWYYSNVEDKPKHLSPGIYGISNHHLDTPWPKVVRGKAKLEASILTASDRIKLESQLWDLLADEHRAEDHELPDTGVGLEWERTLSPIFIRSLQYGTRCSTIVTIDKKNQLVFTERTLRPEIHEHEMRYTLHLPHSKTT